MVLFIETMKLLQSQSLRADKSSGVRWFEITLYIHWNESLVV